MPQDGVYDLLKLLEIALDEGYSLLKYTVVNKKEMETLIDRIYAALPVEVQDARLFLKRKEELQNEAQQRAAKIVQDAQAEADRKLSELYAEQVLTSLEGNLTQLQQVVKNGQIYMEQIRSESANRYNTQAQSAMRR